MRTRNVSLVATGWGHEKIAFGCRHLVAGCHYIRPLYGGGYIRRAEGRTSDGVDRRANVQSVGRLQLRTAEGFARGAEGDGAEWKLRSVPRLQMP